MLKPSLISDGNRYTAVASLYLISRFGDLLSLVIFINSTYVRLFSTKSYDFLQDK